MIRDPDGRIGGVRYVLPRHKAANPVGPGRLRKSTRPGANGVVELSSFESLDRVEDLIPAAPKAPASPADLKQARGVCAKP